MAKEMRNINGMTDERDGWALLLGATVDRCRE